MKITLDPGAAELLNRLHAAGYAAYAVGGCVRDSLLGLSPHDWDLCTSARPEEVLELFGKEQCIPTGLQHGTVTIKQDGRLYETTTFRTEGAYSDGRHPDVVQFVPDVKADLARRDFTINAMAYSEEDGLVDPFGGQKDLKNGLVRAVGQPHKRFEEDALRILRLYRFAARFGFAIDPATEAAAKELSGHLDRVSAERITDEVTRLLAAPLPGGWLCREVFAVVLPELFTPDNAPHFVQAKAVVDALPAGMEDMPARLAALLVPLGEQGTRDALHRLRCSNALVDETAILVQAQGRLKPALPGARRVQARRLLGRLEPQTLRRLLLLCAAEKQEYDADYHALWNEAQDLLAHNVCCRVGQLAVNGRDLIALGIQPGPGLRRVLEGLLEQVITDALPNEREALLASVARFIAS